MTDTQKKALIRLFNKHRADEDKAAAMENEWSEKLSESEKAKDANRTRKARAKVDEWANRGFDAISRMGEIDRVLSILDYELVLTDENVCIDIIQSVDD